MSFDVVGDVGVWWKCCDGRLVWGVKDEGFW